MDEYCYIAIKSCGCVTGFVMDGPEYRKDTSESVAKFIREGYKIERVLIETARDKFGPCKCGKSNFES